MDFPEVVLLSEVFLLYYFYLYKLYCYFTHFVYILNTLKLRYKGYLSILNDQRIMCILLEETHGERY